MSLGFAGQQERLSTPAIDADSQQVRLAGNIRLHSSNAGYVLRSPKQYDLHGQQIQGACRTIRLFRSTPFGLRAEQVLGCVN